MVAYFLQVNVCWLLFYGAYYALLSKETFFWLNRIWLVVSLLCGLALPFVADYFAVKVVPTNLFVMTLEPFVVSATALQRNLAADTEGVVLKALAMVYGLGVAVLAARFLAGLFLIFKLFLQSKREKKDGFTLVFTDGTSRGNREGGIPPFSFFRFIFINPNEFDSVDFQQIMQHEQAHVRQRHSFDVVFMELLNIAFWCSPLVYLYKTSLRNVHEYLADEAVLRTNTTPQYGRLLLRQQQSGVALSLTSNISNHFFSQLKKRILMMTRNKSKRTALIKYALAAPIFLILTAALASPKLPILAKTEVLSEKVVKSIDKLETENINSLLGQINGNQIIGLTKNDSLPSNISNMKEGEMRPYLDNLREGGTMSESEIHNIKELKAYQIVNGKAVECEVTSFVMVWIPRGKDPYQANCYSKTNDEVKRLLGMAKAGEQIQFLQIKARPNGSQNSRDIGSMSMLITENINKSGEKLFKPLSELKLVDEKQIAQMNVDTKEEFNTQITITFKDGHIERYKGTKAEMEKVFKTENDAAAQKTNDQKLAEMVVVGRSTNKNLSEQKIQNVEEVPKGGQQKDKNLTEKTLTDPVFTIVEQNPEFVGGQALLFKWLGENIRYPKSARDAGAQGTVYVGFFVEKDGSITNVNIKRDVPVIIRDTITISEVNGIKGNKIVERTEYTLGKEAVRVISAMPNWKPGKSNGSPVRVAYTLPIKFKLD